MDERTAQQIAGLINEHSGIGTEYCAEMVLERSKSYIIWRGYGETELKGFCRLDKVSWWAAELTHLVVRPEFRRQGIARTLLDQAEQRANDFGVKCLLATVRQNNTPAVYFFQTNGFKKVESFVNQRTGHSVNVFIHTLPYYEQD